MCKWQIIEYDWGREFKEMTISSSIQRDRLKECGLYSECNEKLLEVFK